MMSTQKIKVSWLLGGLILELLFLALVCSRFQLSFPPLPSMIAVALGLAAAHSYPALSTRRISLPRGGNDVFAGRLSEEQLARLASGKVKSFEATAQSYEATAVVCDIANKHDLADEWPPALVAEITEKFIRHARDSFLKAGAYIETVTGEGIVAIFGYPFEDAQQADK